MSWTRIRTWLGSLIRRGRFESTLSDELQFHLEARTEHWMSEGLTEAEARRRARLELGNPERIKEEVRAIRMGAWFERLRMDARAVTRSLVKTPGFTVMAVVLLAFGLAICTVTLIIVNAYFLRGLPYASAERIYAVQYAPAGDEAPANLDSLDWSDLDDVLEHAIAWDLDVFYLLGDSRPEPAEGAWVSPGFIEAFGADTIVGRRFEPDDFRIGQPHVALISHHLWLTRFGGQRDVVGRRVRAYVSDRPDEPETFTIIGVVREDFWHFNPYVEILAPLRAPAHPYMVRVRDGTPPSAVAERIESMVLQEPGRSDSNGRVSLISLRERYVSEMKPLVIAIVIAVGIVFVMTLSNIAILLLLRTRQREHEIALRLSLGGTPAQVRQALAVEAAILGASSTVIALVVGVSSMSWLGPEVERHLGRRVPGGLRALTLDETVLAGVVGLGLASTVLFTLASLGASWRASYASFTSRGARGSAAAWLRPSSAIIVFEVAASLALLTGSVLMVESARRMLLVELGIRTEHIVATGVSLRQRTYPDVADRAAFYERLMDELRHAPGVEAATVSSMWPLQPPRARTIHAESPEQTLSASAGLFAVTPAYFELLEIDVVEGRVFSDRDRSGGEPVAVVSATLAQRLRTLGPVVGGRVRIASDTTLDEALVHRVVGVVADVRQHPADEELADVYVPMSQRAGRFAYLLTRGPRVSSTWDDVLWSTVSSIDPEVSLEPTRSLDTTVEEATARPRFVTWILGSFAAFSVMLSLVGVYGVVAFAVRQRRREVAVRMAVGADRFSVAHLFLRRGVRVVALGLVLGVGGALAAGRVLESLLFGVRPGEPWVLVGTVIALGVCSIVAIAFPALRAASLDPASILRAE